MGTGTHLDIAATDQIRPSAATTAIPIHPPVLATTLWGITQSHAYDAEMLDALATFSLSIPSPASVVIGAVAIDRKGV